MKKAILIICMLSLLFLISCKNSKIELIDYYTILNDTSSRSKSECPKHGQKYVTHQLIDFENVEVMCYQESPVRFFYYQIK